jgi:Uma2 family endonuclease
MSELLPSAGLPDVDERLAVPETRYEVIDGKPVYVSPADKPHGEIHLALAALVKAHVADGFSAAVDLLTRTSLVDDIAPDVSVYPAAPTARGGRQLEHLAFEIASKQALSKVADKARRLAGRGVRRVFAVDLKKGRVLEWMAETASWTVLDRDGAIVDVALAVPMPVAPMLDAAKAHDAMVEAFRSQRHTGFLEERAEGRVEGRLEGRLERTAEAILVVFAARGIAVSTEQATRIRSERDAERLERWFAAVLDIGDVSGLLALV